MSWFTEAVPPLATVTLNWYWSDLLPENLTCPALIVRPLDILWLLLPVNFKIPLPVLVKEPLLATWPLISKVLSVVLTNTVRLDPAAALISPEISSLLSVPLIVVLPEKVNLPLALETFLILRVSPSVKLKSLLLSLAIVTSSAFEGWKKIKIKHITNRV